ncbi:replication initiator protein [robinz microvirus RP_115]|nr:replication initiator protein [robinz microvirus RP_115]
MSCYGPIPAYRPRLKEGGDKRLVFDPRKSETGVRFLIPCGRCTGCRLERSRQWAMRCMHEKQMHSASSFVTLTYDDKHIPEGGSLSMDHYVRFMKRLRHHVDAKVRFCGCGEYGDVTFRPHYHLLLLNVDFGDRRYLKLSASGLPLYSSKLLESLWSEDGESLGHCNIGNVDFDSCAYVARYVMKKVIGNDTFDSSLYCPVTGIVREAPFMTMSRRPGLGSSWYAKFGPHAYEWDSVVFKGVEVPPPRFYDGLRVGPAINDNLKKKRRRKAALNRADNTLARLRVKEVVALAKLNLKGRSL